MTRDYQKADNRDLDLTKARADGRSASWQDFLDGYAKLIRATVHLTLLRYKPEQFDLLADDACQEVYTALLENDGKRLRQFEGRRDCSLSTWLRLVVSRLVIDFLRKQGRHEKHQVDWEKLDIEKLPCSTWEHPEEAVNAAHEKAFVDKALTSLNDRDKLLMRLLYDDGLPVETVARITGLKPGAIYTRLSRIRDRLRDLADKAGLKM
jgi:RNA polymerase sigma factor (sigma-70 family)